MSFWALQHHRTKIAVIDSMTNKHYSYQLLQDLIDIIKRELATFPKKTLGIVLVDNNIESIIGYLAALQSNNAVLLLNANLDNTLLMNLLALYQPEWVLSPSNICFSDEEYAQKTTLMSYSFLFKKQLHDDKTHAIYPELAVLLSTSGTTGSPKVVRLSYTNLTINTNAIATYLHLSDLERPITTLPMSYAYGLSILNSHLLVGATILLTKDSILIPQFWDFARSYKLTSIAGVPYLYHILKQISFHKVIPPTLRSLTQAGGRLSLPLTKHFISLASQHKWLFYVMYGQTEATARISYVPPESLEFKLGSIGIPIPGCELTLEPTTQELIVSGLHVMLGYASSRKDLIKGDECLGKLHTGDIGYQDSDGFYYVSGRASRFVKIHGLRINLDDIETLIENTFSCKAACVGNDNKIGIFVSEEQSLNVIKRNIVDKINIHPSVIFAHHMESSMMTHVGKINYKKISNIFEGSL